jgi:hypothetical protein
MAFPGTYNISYYKGDTFEFKVYPKDASGAAFNLTDFLANGTAKFTIATARGTGATQVLGTATISSDLTHVACVITPSQGSTLSSAVQYVYDVEISRTVSGSYPYVYTLLTGTVSVTDQVSGAE